MGIIWLGKSAEFGQVTRHVDRFQNESLKKTKSARMPNVLVGLLTLRPAPIRGCVFMHVYASPRRAPSAPPKNCQPTPFLTAKVRALLPFPFVPFFFLHIID